MTTSRSNPLASWDPTRQQAYRTEHPEDVVVFHVLLDASGSMYAHESALRSAYNMYLHWLQRHGPPMALMDTRCFGTHIQGKEVQPLGRMRPLHPETYAAAYGGTALFDAVGTVVTQASEPGQHILVVFTDGLDSDSAQWTIGQVHELLTTVQSESRWLCVFLGAFQAALATALDLGFREGNCLVFGSEKIPEAFERLRRATETYLIASPQQRLLLAHGGVFHEGVSV
jgi:hypothetical protein